MNETREIIKRNCRNSQQYGNGDTIRRKTTNQAIPVTDDNGYWTLKHNRVARLTKPLSIIHNHMMGIEMSYQRDVVNLQKLYYNTYYRPLQELRSTLFATISREKSSQPTKEDIEELVRNTNLFLPKSGSYNDLIDHCQNFASGGHYLVKTSFAKNFWLRVLWKSDSIVSKMIRRKEAQVLKYLIDINCELINFSKEKDGQKKGTTHGFGICFKFARANPYFYNRRIWKRYVVDIRSSETPRVVQTEKDKEDTNLSESEELVSYEGPRIVEVSGTNISWKNNGKARRFKSKDEKYPANSLISYLQFGWNEETEEKHHEAELDYMIGNYIRTKLIPNAYGIFRRKDVITTPSSETSVSQMASEEKSLKPHSSIGTTTNMEMEDLSLGADCTNTMEQYSEISSSGNRSAWTEADSNRNLLSLLESEHSDDSVSSLSEHQQIYDEQSERDQNETTNTQLSLQMSDIEDVLGVASPNSRTKGDRIAYAVSRNFKRLRKSSSELGQSSIYNPNDPVVRRDVSMTCCSLDYDKEVEMLTKDMDEKYKIDGNCTTPTTTLNSPMGSVGASLFDAIESRHQSQIDPSHFDGEMSPVVHFPEASTAPSRKTAKRNKSMTKNKQLESSKQLGKKRKSMFRNGNKAKMLHQTEVASHDEYACFDNSSSATHSITLSALRDKLDGHATTKCPRKSTTPFSDTQHHFNAPNKKASKKRKKKYQISEFTLPKSDASCSCHASDGQEVYNKPPKRAGNKTKPHKTEVSKLMLKHREKDRTTNKLTESTRNERAGKPAKKRFKYLVKQRDYDVFDDEVFYPPQSLVYDSSSDTSDMEMQATGDHFLGDEEAFDCEEEDPNNAENKSSIKTRKSSFDPKLSNIGVSVPSERKNSGDSYTLHPATTNASDTLLSGSIKKNIDKEHDKMKHYIDGKEDEQCVSPSSSTEGQGFLPSLKKISWF